jgi:hypothetical protein
MTEKGPEQVAGTDAGDDERAIAARRETLQRLGLLGAVTAPALLMLLNPGRAAAISVTSGATN